MWMAYFRINFLSYVYDCRDYVIVGVHDIRTMPNDGVYPIVKVVLYPGYKEHSIKDDIAVIKVARPIIFDTLVQPICLPRKHNQYYNNKALIVSGWGEIATGI